MLKFAVSTLAATALLTTTAYASPVVIHFDDFSTDTLTSPNATYNTSNAKNRPTYATSPGVPDLSGPGNDVTQVNGRAARSGSTGLTNAFAATLATSVGDFTAYESFQVSSYFRANVVTTNGNRGQIGGVGLSNMNNGFWTDGTITPIAHSGFEVLVVGTGTTSTAPNTVDLRIRNINVGGIATTTSAVTSGPLLNQVWYQLVFNVTRTLSGTYDLSAELFQLDAGETGTRPGWYTPTSVASISVTGLTNTNIAADTALYAGFGVRRNQISGNDLTGFGAADNFRVEGTLIPEPASLALLAMGGALLVGRRRR